MSRYFQVYNPVTRQVYRLRHVQHRGNHHLSWRYYDDVCDCVPCAASCIPTTRSFHTQEPASPNPPTPSRPAPAPRATILGSLCL